MLKFIPLQEENNTVHEWKQYTVVIKSWFLSFARRLIHIVLKGKKKKKI